MILTIDVETTTHNKGNPFDERNKLVCVAYKLGDNPSSCTSDLSVVNAAVRDATLLVNHNIKFDLHWLHRAGIDLTGKRVYDTMLAEFLLTNQVNRLPSLDSCCEKYGLDRKIDIVKEEYWQRKCSCHVSIAEKLNVITQKDYAQDATVNSKQGNAVLPIQKVRQFVSDVTIQNFIADVSRQAIIKRTLALSKYRLTDEQYNSFLGETECGICKKIKPLCIDHSHSTGKYRGALCRPCNAFLGHVENAEWLQAAQQYVQFHAS